MVGICAGMKTAIPKKIKVIESKPTEDQDPITELIGKEFPVEDFDDVTGQVGIRTEHFGATGRITLNAPEYVVTEWK